MGPAFNRLWASSLVSNLADGVLMAAAPLLAITLTDSTVLISAIGAMVMLPWLLFAMPIGVMVDRVDRRFILAGSNAIRSAVIGAVALGIATDHITIYWLIFSGFIIGVCEVATDTTAQSLIPQILDEEHYEKAMKMPPTPVPQMKRTGHPVVPACCGVAHRATGDYP